MMTSKGLFARKARGVDGGSHVRFGLSGPHGDSCLLPFLDHTGPQLSL